MNSVPHALKGKMLDEKKLRRRLRKARKEVRALKEMGFPPADKMVREPEEKKLWELLVQRERNIHSGDRLR